jgi:glutamate formiminotransferase/formiminotetrahydrofolate cyclodeaminase
MDKIVECVPNFSEGRDLAVVKAITDEIDKTEGARLLDVDPNGDYNRVVVTFVGDTDSVWKAAFAATAKAAQLIDMTKHKGEHPRMGAADVVPFVPVRGVTMDTCVEISKKYGREVGEKLGIPVYLYEYAATSPERSNLASVRKGEYEGLIEKMKDPEWKPDFGPAVFNSRSGATVTGARVFLIAYNVNLATKDVAVADEIAQRIRESGRPMRDEHGKVVKDERGNTRRIPGSLKATKAMGVLLERHGITQVSINLVNYEITPPHVAFEEVRKEAKGLKVRVTGSEIVGMTPLTPMIMAGRYFLEKAGKSTNVSEKEMVRVAIEQMGLSQLAPFEPGEKIIEYRIS